jgi:hypothetical protein
VPIELRHLLEVHAVDRGNDGRWHEDDRDHREELDDVVLNEVDAAERRVSIRSIQIALGGICRLDGSSSWRRTIVIADPSLAAAGFTMAWTMITSELLWLITHAGCRIALSDKLAVASFLD